MIACPLCIPLYLFSLIEKFDIIKKLCGTPENKRQYKSLCSCQAPAHCCLVMMLFSKHLAELHLFSISEKQMLVKQVLL